MTWLLGFLPGGWRLYALAAVGIALAVLGGSLYVQGLRLDSARAHLKAAEALTEQYKQDLAEAEADKALLRELQRKLDLAIKERDKRMLELQKVLGELDAEYEKLEKSVGAEDQACLRRDLPPAFAERLRD